MRKPDTDETIGNNVHGIRIARRISMQEAVNGMRELGHSWSKTTLFSIEHNTRRLLASEAFDFLICLGYDPEKDLMLIFGEPPSPADYSIQRCGRCATKVEDAWNVYLGALEVAEKSLTAETEKGEITKEYADAQQKKLRTWERSMSEAIKKRRSEHGTGTISLKTS
ncbi:hypothetical protein R9679_06105 [Bifidobacterium breve]|nr:hypothetical protein R9679_06105 [Bifidobacterium breve]